ncbi:MAG: type ISP restriction/modification enzyme [Candidatus Kapaibacterium sp.]
MKKNKKLAKVYHYDLYGKRDEKYKFLDEKSVNNIEWNELEYNEPYYFFVSKDFEDIKSYNSGFNVSEIFNDYNSGIQTKNDSITVHFNESSLNKIINDFSNLSVEELKEKYLIKDGVWKTVEAKKDILEKSYKMTKVLYKLFDYRYTILTRRSGGFIGRPRGKVMLDMTNSNIGLCLMRTTVDSKTYSNIFLSEIPIDLNLYGFQTFIFPLYLYPEAGEQATLDQSSSEPTTPSFGHPSRGGECREKESEDSPPVGGVGYEASRGGSNEYFTPIDLLDYIYAVLHSPTYREKYKEFLKIDFPRVPYPKDKKKFWQLVDLGSQIRQLHLLETADKYITSYPNDGTNIVERKMTKNSIGYEQTGDGVGRVWINDEQYFDGVPEVAWEFYIGGYQPAQKWLKDRVGRELNFEDINHYQKIIVALTETDRLMKEVDKVGVE